MAQTDQCIGCVRYQGYGDERPECEAFPGGIPDLIFTGEHDHTEPFPGDNGLRFAKLNVPPPQPFASR